MILSASLGASALLYAQDEKQQEVKPKQEEPKKQDEAKPSRQRDEMKPSKQDEQDKKTQQQDEKQMRRQGQEPQSNEGMQGRQQAENAHRGAKGGHIPDEKFRSHFGRGHTFKAQTVVVAGRPQFSYAGYTFELVDAWPVAWAYSDDCYIDYVDGEYFLFDLLHPGIRIAVFVVM
jgi:hypothetical protein